MGWPALFAVGFLPHKTSICPDVSVVLDIMSMQTNKMLIFKNKLTGPYKLPVAVLLKIAKIIQK